MFELQHQGSTLSWHFIFDGSRPFLPPEVVLEPRGFDPVASDPSIATLLDTWMVTDETALVRLVTAMRQALAGHAGKLARGVACPRVQFEMETLSSTPNVDISGEIHYRCS